MVTSKKRWTKTATKLALTMGMSAFWMATTPAAAAADPVSAARAAALRDCGWMSDDDWATALIGATPALARDGQTSLALAAAHELAWPTANDARANQNHNYRRGFSQRSGYQWDPWGHWGNYYGPMIGFP